MEWIGALRDLHSIGQPAVLVTLVSTRGHSPRSAGAKMVVTAEKTWDSVGGGNLEATAIDHARDMLASGARSPESQEITLNEHAHARHGTQCCGGVVSLLFEPIAAPPTVAVFGLGHIGCELAHMLSRLEINLHLTDSREGFADSSRFHQATQGRAYVHVHYAPAPEAVLSDLPAESHVLIMSHDHAEDLFLCEAALQRDDLGSVGVIGSAAKWSRFRKKLREAGYPGEQVEQIACPIGLPGITGKSPAVIALSVAASLVQSFQHDTYQPHRELP